MTKLAIIIVSYNTREMLRRCLAAVMPNAVELPAEVVVVDNASRDGSAEMVQQEFPDVRLMRNSKNVGFSRANNQAIKSTNSEYVLLLNSDAFPINNAFQELLKALMEDDVVATAGPRMYDEKGVLLASAHAFESLGKLAAAVLSPHQLIPRIMQARLAGLIGKAGSQHAANYTAAEPKVVDWISGACMLVRRSAIEKAGLLDEEYFMYMEDEDWCRRFRAAGYKVKYVPAAKLTHFCSGSSGASLQKARIYRDSRLLYHRRYHPKLYPVIYIFANLYAVKQIALDMSVRIARPAAGISRNTISLLAGK